MSKRRRGRGPARRKARAEFVARKIAEKRARKEARAKTPRCGHRHPTRSWVCSVPVETAMEAQGCKAPGCPYRPGHRSSDDPGEP